MLWFIGLLTWIVWPLEPELIIENPTPLKTLPTCNPCALLINERF